MRVISKRIGFYLSRRNKFKGNDDIPRQVILMFNYHAKTFTSGVGITVSDNNWDHKRQRIKIGVLRSQQINQYLDKLSEKLNDIYFTALSEGVNITNDYLREQLRKNQVGHEEPQKTFWDYYTVYLETQKMVIKTSSYKSIMTGAKRFKEFCKAERNLNIKFEDVTPRLLALYTEFLLRRGNTNNTIHSQIKRVRRFLNYARKLHLHTNESYREYNIPERIGSIKFLEWHEVKQLMQVQLDSPVQEKSRDLLLFGCFTGMRYSDIRALKKIDIKQHVFDGVEGVFYAAHIRQVKTSRETVIPLLPEAMAIIRKYESLPGESALPQMFLQKVNDALKIVGEKAKLNAMQKIEVFRGTVKETTYIEKWRVLSTHTGRRTFVTISATKGLPINIVASITGQNPATTMRHYMGVINAEKFKELTARLKFD